MTVQEHQLFVYGQFYCPMLNLFGPARHCEMCIYVTVEIPYRCYKENQFFPILNSIKENDLVWYSWDDLHWIRWDANPL